MTAQSAPVRVFTSNLGMGRGDPAAVVAAAEQTANVVVIQELTQEAADGLIAAGLENSFGHRIFDPEPMAGGLGIWSRFPLTDSAHVPGYSMVMLRSRIQVPERRSSPGPGRGPFRRAVAAADRVVAQRHGEVPDNAA